MGGLFIGRSLTGVNFGGAEFRIFAVKKIQTLKLRNSIEIKEAKIENKHLIGVPQI